MEFLKRRNIRPSKSPYGAPLFFVKENDKELPGVVKYRAMNRITQKKKQHTRAPFIREFLTDLELHRYFLNWI